MVSPGDEHGPAHGNGQTTRKDLGDLLRFSSGCHQEERRRGRALLTLHVAELEWRWQALGRALPSWLQQEKHGALRRGHSHPQAPAWGSLGWIPFLLPQTPGCQFSRRRLRSHPPPSRCPSEGAGKGAGIPSPVTGQPGKRTAAYGVQKPPELWPVKDGACHRWVTSLQTEGERSYFDCKRAALDAGCCVTNAYHQPAPGAGTMSFLFLSSTPSALFSSPLLPGPCRKNLVPHAQRKILCWLVGGTDKMKTEQSQAREPIPSLRMGFVRC